MDHQHLQAQSESPFFSLPREIRDTVYQYALAFDDDDFTPLRGRADRDKNLNFTSLPAFVKACKMLYLEAVPLALSQAYLRLHFDDDENRHFTSMAAYSVPHRAGSRYRWGPKIQHLVVVVQTADPRYQLWVPEFGLLMLHRMPALRTVSFQWHCDPPGSSAARHAEDLPQDMSAFLESHVERLVNAMVMKQPALRTVYFQGVWAWRPAWVDEVEKRTDIRVVHDGTPFKVQPTRRGWSLKGLAQRNCRYDPSG